MPFFELTVTLVPATYWEHFTALRGSTFLAAQPSDEPFLPIQWIEWSLVFVLVLVEKEIWCPESGVAMLSENGPAMPFEPCQAMLG